MARGDRAAAVEEEPSVIFMIDALCAADTLRRPSRRASMNAYSAIRVQPFSVKTLSVSTTPGTTSCSRPA